MLEFELKDSWDLDSVEIPGSNWWRGKDALGITFAWTWEIVGQLGTGSVPGLGPDSVRTTPCFRKPAAQCNRICLILHGKIFIARDVLSLILSINKQAAISRR